MAHRAPDINKKNRRGPQDRVGTEKLLPVFIKFKKHPKRSTVSSVWRVFEFLPKPGTNPKGWCDVLHWHGCRHCCVIRVGDLVGRARAPAAVRGHNSFDQD